LLLAFSTVALVPRDRRWIGLVALVPIAGAAAWWCSTGMGRAPVLVAAFGSCVAVAVTDGWWTPVRWFRSGPVATVAVPLVVLAGLLWFLRGSLPVFVSVSTAAVAIVVLCGVRADAVAGWYGNSFHRWRSSAPAGGHAPEPPGPSNVRLAESGPAKVAATGRGLPDARQQRLRDRSRRRSAGVAVGVLALTGALVLVGRTASNGSVERPLPVETTTDEPQSLVLDVPFGDRPAFTGQPEIEVLEAEQRTVASSLVADPVTRTSVPDFAGRTTNVEDGRRLTVTSGCSGCPSARLWLVGGSAAFGLGQRDDFTITSELVRAAERDGINLEVVNLSAPGWTGWQEAAAVGRRLDGLAPSDVIVVYDGFNDVLGTLLGSAARGGVEDDGRPVVAVEDVAALTERWRPLSSAGDPVVVGRDVAVRHRRAQEELLAAAKGVGAEVRYVVQPDALASPVQRSAAEQEVDARLAAEFDYLDAVLEESAREMERAGALNLRHAFDGVQQVVFGDLVHSNERGAALAAQAVYPQLRPLLRASAGGR